MLPSNEKVKKLPGTVPSVVSTCNGSDWRYDPFDWLNSDLISTFLKFFENFKNFMTVFFVVMTLTFFEIFENFK